MDPTPEDRPLRFGVLGCAAIAWRNTLPALGRARGATLVAVASRDRDKAERFARRFGCEAVQGYDRLLDRADIDAVYVPLPTGLHHHWVARALRAGKHVLAEKPLCTRLAEAEELVALARAEGRWLMENFMFLHHSQHRAALDLLLSGGIGELRTFSAVFGIPSPPPDDVRHRADLGGGALLDLGVYPLRAARMFLGDGLAVTGSVLRTRQGSGVDLGGSAVLHGRDGVSATISFHFGSSYRSAYELWGSQGRITLERAFTTPPALRPTLRIERQDHLEERSLPPDDQYANIVDTFARRVAGEEPFEPYGAALLGQAATVDQVRERAQVVRS